MKFTMKIPKRLDSSVSIVECEQVDTSWVRKILVSINTFFNATLIICYTLVIVAYYIT